MRGFWRRFGKSLNERGSAPCCTRIIDCAALHFSFPGGIIVPKFQGHCRFADGGASFFGAASSVGGLGTLLFHLITKKKVPAFLGSSFAYLGGFSIVAPMLADADGNLTVANTKMLPYACAAVAFSGLVYLVASLLISTFGIRRIMRPPLLSKTASPTGCWPLWHWVS